MISDQILIIGTALISAGTGGVLTGLFHRSLVQAKVKSIIAGTYDKLIETLNGEVEKLQKDVIRLRDRLDILNKKELEYLEQITTLTKKNNVLTLELQKCQKANGNNNRNSRNRKP